MSQVVVVGSANTDLVCKVAHLPQPGETITGGRFFQAAGGKGANQAVAAARLGAHVTFVARVGADAHGDAAVAGYAADGIDTRWITRDEAAPSGVALILVDAGGENVIAVAPGANQALRPEHVLAAEEAFTTAQVVLLQLEVPLDTVAAAATLARRHGARVVLNPAPMPAGGLPTELLAQVDVLTPNAGEAALLGAVVAGDDAATATALRRLGVPAVVLTRGSRGALLVTAETTEAVAAPRVAAVDTVGAGDAFNGALAVGLAEGRPWREAVAWACAAGAQAATREGAQPSLPHRGELPGGV